MLKLPCTCHSPLCHTRLNAFLSLLSCGKVQSQVFAPNMYLMVGGVSLWFLGRVHTTALGPERFRNATGRPCSHLFHCVQSFRNEPTTSRCDRSGTVPERVRLALWCERATGPVPEPFQLPVTFVDSQPILHISKRSSLHGILPQIV